MSVIAFVQVVLDVAPEPFTFPAAAAPGVGRVPGDRGDRLHLPLQAEGQMIALIVAWLA